MTFIDIMDLWPSQKHFWEDLTGEHPGLAYPTVRSWHQRDSISGGYYDAIVEAARRRGFTQVTHEMLCRAAAEAARSERPTTLVA